MSSSTGSRVEHRGRVDDDPLVMVTCTDYLPAQRVWANRAVVIATPMA
jgi:hypothetical protein